MDNLSVHYAEALANAVFAPNSGLTPEDAVAQLRSAEALFTGSKPLEHAILSPAVSKTRKQSVIDKLASDMALHRLIRNFLVVLVKHRRTREISAICGSFEEEVDHRQGWVPAEIASAQELSADQKAEIERTLQTKLGKSIRAKYLVDSALIGGIRARVASREYDATVKGKLESMRQRLAFRH